MFTINNVDIDSMKIRISQEKRDAGPKNVEIVDYH